VIRLEDLDAELRRSPLDSDMVERASIWLFGLINSLKANGALLPLAPGDVERLGREIDRWQAALDAIRNAIDDATAGADALASLTPAQRAQLSFQRHYRVASIEGVPPAPAANWTNGGNS
jgi:hypothetical protein